MAGTQTTIHSSVSNTRFTGVDRSIAKTYLRIGYAVIVLFFGSVFAWSTLVPISSAAIAPGLVSKDGRRKTIQHLEGGIIHKIYVKDGDPVNAGQALIELDNIQSRADFDLLNKQKLIATVKEACLLAESRGENKVNLPLDIDLASLDEAVRVAILGQIYAFTARRESYNSQSEIIGQQIAQARGKIEALNAEHVSLSSKGSLIREELEEYREFEQKGLVTRSQVFSLRRDAASNETEIRSNRVAVESTRQELNSLKMEKSELAAENTKRIVAELNTVRDQLVDANEKLAKTEDRLERTLITAPIEGVIVDLKVNTIGGVVKPGQALLDIVPNQGQLVIDAQVDPKDRDTVRVGHDAEVRFTAFNQRITQPVKGKVVLISADRLVNSELDGKPTAYYKAKIELLENPAQVMNGSPVYPGMQADVMIITGKRTAMAYFLKPIIKSFNRSFRDD